MRATTAHVAWEGGGPRSSLKAIVAKLQEAYELLEASVKDVMRALRSLQYSGWIDVEQDFTSTTPRESCQTSMEYAHAVLGSI